MKLAKRIRRAATALTTPLLPDDYTHLIDPLWSARELRGRIEKITQTGNDTAELVIRPGWSMPTHFHPGQFIGIGLRIGGKYFWRSYSLTNAPAPRDGMLTITVKAQQEGFLSQHLVAHAKPGTIVRLAAPSGEFYLPEPIPSKLVFVTAGTGITPVMSMLRELKKRAKAGATGIDVIHCHSERGDNAQAFLTELRQLQQASERGELGFSYTLNLRNTEKEQRFSADEVAQLVPDFAERTEAGGAFACGPTALLNALEEKFPAIKTERFVLDRSNVDAQGGVVSFADRGEIEVDGATTILEAGEKAGMQLPYGCRMGICSTCTQQLADGVARDLHTGETHFAGEQVRVCVCVPAGNVEIKL